MQKMKKWLAAILSGVLLLTPCLTFADEEAAPTAEAVQETENDGAETASYVRAVVEFLNLYARYSEVDRASLYQAGLMAALQADPSLSDVVLRAILASIDENSAYYSKEEAEAFLSALSDEFAGIGIVTQTVDNRVYVQSVVADGPAQRAGILPGDLIERIDGVDVSALSAEETLALLSGEAATSVEIEVTRVDTGETLHFSMYRETLLTPSVQSKIMEENGQKIYYIRVSSFNDQTAEEFKAVMQNADEQRIKKIIIDLRNNGGGVLNVAIEMAEMFLPPGAIITTEDHKIKLFNQVYKSQNSWNPDYETVVLINGQSASASEVFAAALKENDKAVLIGERSYGKGTVQYLKSLQDGTAMKYTAAYYLTPLGNNIHGKGIMPDAVVENTYEPIDMEEYQEFSYNTVYQWGDQGEDVRTAKELLSLLGIYKGEIDDVFTTELDLAVRYFQRMVGLYSYGDLDITTQIQLWNGVKTAQKVIDDQLTAAVDHLAPPQE